MDTDTHTRWESNLEREITNVRLEAIGYKCFLFLLGFIARGYPSKLMLLNILEFLPQFAQFRPSKAVTYGPKYLSDSQHFVPCL